MDLFEFIPRCGQNGSNTDGDHPGSGAESGLKATSWGWYRSGTILSIKNLRNELRMQLCVPDSQRADQAEYERNDRRHDHSGINIQCQWEASRKQLGVVAVKVGHHICSKYFVRGVLGSGNRDGDVCGGER